MEPASADGASAIEIKAQQSDLRGIALLVVVAATLAVGVGVALKQRMPAKQIGSGLTVSLMTEPNADEPYQSYPPATAAPPELGQILMVAGQSASRADSRYNPPAPRSH